MKIAIIGAGLAGLSCAIVLERHGIIPVVYEKNGFIGEREQHVGAILNIIDRPITDFIKYVKTNFDINIMPVNTVNELVHYAPNATTIIHGNFGYFTRRDREKDSIKQQLYSQLHKTKVQLGIEANYKQLCEDYDYVVAADGKPDIAEEIGVWSDWITGVVMGAVVHGDFNPNALIMWLDRIYCKNGYAYLTPFNNRKASLALYVPDCSVDAVDNYWNTFLQQEQIKYEIVETFKVKHTSGFVYPHRFNNMFLAGNTGGSIDPFLGFGQVKSILMGALSAKAIIENLDYEKLVLPICKANLRLYEMRKAFNKATNKNYDTIVKMIGFPGVKPVLYDTSLNVLKYGDLALKIAQKLKKHT